MNTKLVRVPITVKDGDTVLTEKVLTFAQSNAPKECMICEICPYYNICDKIPNPEDLSNGDSKFHEFCALVGSKIKEISAYNGGMELLEDSELFPIAGTIENNLHEFFDINQELIKKDPLVKLNDLIEKVCSGWCDGYTPEHVNCTADKKDCILCSLFENTNTEYIKKNFSKDTEEEKTEAKDNG